MKYPNLSSPLSIRGLTLRNRACMSPMGTGLAGPEGEVTDDLIEYYRRRAQGGCALLIVEAASVSPQGKTIPRELSIHDDPFIPGLRMLARAIHEEGGLAGIQLHHPGRSSNPRVTGVQPVGPSAVACPMYRVVPRPLSVEEVQAHVQYFAEGARRAKEAGFDGVEIHGGHGYLVAQFLSPQANLRTDRYGGSAEKRSRFAAEILRACRETVGQDYPLFIRLSGKEYVEGGISLEQSLVTAPLLEAAGADLLDVSGGTTYAAEWVIMPACVPPGIHVPLAAAIRKKVRIPVMTVGRIHDPGLAEEILRDGKADLIGLGRQLVADPDWPRKAFAGQEELICRCIACNECLHHAVIRQERIVCTQNPAAGREKDSFVTRARRKKKVVVVGGGPGGLEAARMAALRGHTVTLVEEGQVLGGRLRIACVPPHKEIYHEVIRYRAQQLSDFGIRILLNTRATLPLLRSMEPDAVVIATGTVPSVPDLRGACEPFVVTYDRALSEPLLEGERIAVVGGGSVGCEVADHLSSRGKRVLLIEMLPRIALDMEWNNRVFLVKRLKEKGVEVLTSAKVLSIESGQITCLQGDTERILNGLGAVVLAVGMVPDSSLLRECAQETGWEVYCVGDVIKPRKALQAVQEGAKVGLAV